MIEKKGQDSQKVAKALYFTYLGRSPTQPVCSKICRVIVVPDVITCAKFGLKFSGVTILRGVDFPIFLLILAWALQQCSVYCAACDYDAAREVGEAYLCAWFHCRTLAGFCCTIGLRLLTPKNKKMMMMMMMMKRASVYT